MKRVLTVFVISILLSMFFVGTLFHINVYASSNVSGVSTSRRRWTEAIDNENQVTSSGVNSANVTTYNTSVYYSYVEKVTVEVYFEDSQLHSGSFTFTNTVSNTLWLSDNENVAVIGDTIYFADKSSFNIYTLVYHLKQSSIQINGSQDINITSFTEVQSGTQDYSTILSTISSRINTTNTRLNTINTSIGSVNTTLGQVLSTVNSIYTSLANIATVINAINSELIIMANYLSNIDEDLDDVLTEMIDQGITLDNIYTYQQARHDWDIPVESFSINWALFYNLGNSYQSIRNYDYWQKYPIFTVPSNTDIFTSRGATDHYIDFIIGINQNVVASTVGDYFSVSSGTLKLVKHLGQFSPSYRFVYLRIENTGDAQVTVTYTGVSQAKIIGIFLGRDDNHVGISQTFYENWFNIDNSEIDEFQDQVDEVIDADEDIHDIEDDFLDDFDYNFNQIDLTDPFEEEPNFGTSSKWLLDFTDSLAEPFKPWLIVIMVIFFVYVLWG